MSKPALTPEEWAETSHYLPIHDGSLCDFMVMDTEDAHKTAAKCLHNQEFGFTREHVAMLREEAERYWALADPEEYGMAEMAREREALADLIEALLPPEES